MKKGMMRTKKRTKHDYPLGFKLAVVDRVEKRDLTDKLGQW